MAGFSREGILHRDRFSASAPEVGQLSPALAQNTSVFRGVGPGAGSITLSAGQNDKNFCRGCANKYTEMIAFEPKADIRGK